MESFFIYTITIGISVAIAAIYQKKENRKHRLLWKLYIILPTTLLGGFRYGIGTDYYAYVDLYRTYSHWNLKDVSLFEDQNVGFLFKVLIRVCSAIYDNPSTMFFTAMFLTLFIAIIAFDKIRNKISIPLALSLYYAIYYLASYNVIRQILSTSIVILAVVYLSENKYVKYLLLTICAGFIHASAFGTIIYLAVKLISRRSKLSNIKRILFFTGICAIVFFCNTFLNYISIGIAKTDTVNYVIYLTNIGSATTKEILASLFQISIILIPMIVFQYRHSMQNEEEEFWYLLAWLVIPFSLMSSLGYWAIRLIYLGMVGCIFEILLLCRLTNDNRVYLLKDGLRHNLSLYQAYYLILMYGYFYVYQVWVLGFYKVIPYASLH